MDYFHTYALYQLGAYFPLPIILGDLDWRFLIFLSLIL